MRSRLAASLLSLAVLLSLPASAASPRDALLVDAAWLKAHAADPGLVLLHVGERAGYDEGHIPGARYVALADISVSDRTATGLILELPPADDLRHRLEALGISDASKVVVYFGKDWYSPTTRVVFTLDAAGLGERTFLLDGGQDAWVRAGGSLTKDVPAATTGTLSPLRTKTRVVDAAFVAAHVGTPGWAVVDGRAKAFYDGVDTAGSSGEAHRTGHIRGALSIPFTEVFDDRGTLRSEEDLGDLFTKAGVKPGDTVIAYCHIGQQATAIVLAARALGHGAFLFDGSFQDWSRRKELPVENPSEKGKAAP